MATSSSSSAAYEPYYVLTPKFFNRLTAYFAKRNTKRKAVSPVNSNNLKKKKLRDELQPPSEPPAVRALEPSSKQQQQQRTRHKEIQTIAKAIADSGTQTRIEPSSRHEKTYKDRSEDEAGSGDESAVEKEEEERVKTKGAASKEQLREFEDYSLERFMREMAQAESNQPDIRQIVRRDSSRRKDVRVYDDKATGAVLTIHVDDAKAALYGSGDDKGDNNNKKQHDILWKQWREPVL